MAQWLRICFATQRTQVQSLVGGLEPTCRGAPEPESGNHWACAPEPECAGRASTRKKTSGDGGARPRSLPCVSSSPGADVLWERLAGQRWAPCKRRPFFSECFFSSELVLVNVLVNFPRIYLEIMGFPFKVALRRFSIVLPEVRKVRSLRLPRLFIQASDRVSLVPIQPLSTIHAQPGRRVQF